MATSIIVSSGSKVVRRCIHRPGCETILDSTLSERPAHFRISYEIPTKSGNMQSLYTIRIPVLVHGSTAYKKMLIMMTRIIKLVPQRGWKRLCLRMFSTVSGRPAS